MTRDATPSPRTGAAAIAADRPPRRSKAQQRAETRARLVRAARGLFAERGYAGTSIDAILERTGLARGALYHHFRDKQDLFRAVVVEVLAEVAAETQRAADRESDPWAALVAGFEAYLAAVSRPDVLRLLFTEAHPVISYEEWNRLDQEHGIRVLDLLLGAATRAGHLHAWPRPLFARMLCGAIDYGTEWAMEREGEEGAAIEARLAEVRATFLAVLEGLRLDAPGDDRPERRASKIQTDSRS